ncbi:MAG TPA: DegT/DnrJ/EryC1/StrS family aminotransferase [Myxococcota bacterium]|jgi:dTDP-4-amino-4,6-dideoxygalactose transaminase
MLLRPPHRLDLLPRDLLRGLRSLAHDDDAKARRELERAWGGRAFLSVRSGLCALLEACAFPAGSEIVISALTIGDIPKIIRAYGLVPVAVDVDASTLAPGRAAIEAAVTDKTRAIVIAHLFGARADLAAASRIAWNRGLLLIEDCAQSFGSTTERGDADADVSMFSFGTLKTQTALGGALFTIRDPALAARMAEVEARWPKQRTRAFAHKLAKAALFLLAQNALVYSALALALLLAGRSIGTEVRKATRGFPAATVDALLVLLRQRPCAPLLDFMHARVLDVVDGASERLLRRASAGERLLARWRGRNLVPGERALGRTHWLFGIRSRDPVALREALLRTGVDASGASNILAVGGVRAQSLVDELVFVPIYPELPRVVIDRIVRVVESAELAESVASDARVPRARIA